MRASIPSHDNGRLKLTDMYFMAQTLAAWCNNYLASMQPLQGRQQQPQLRMHFQNDFDQPWCEAEYPSVIIYILSGAEKVLDGPEQIFEL
jgi:hypothetical protein